MKFSMSRALTIARREYLTTIKRKAFLFTVIAMPAYFAFVMTFSISLGTKEAKRAMSETNTIALVDSTGLLAAAPPVLSVEISEDANPFDTSGKPPVTSKFSAEVRRYPTEAAATEALKKNEVQQVLVLPPSYMENGAARRYSKNTGLIGSSGKERALLRWMTGALLAGRVDSALAERAVRPGKALANYQLDEEKGGFVLQNDLRETLSFMVPLALAMLLATSIVTGGQYLLQGVAEEKESRILESLLCTVSTDDLMVGKLIGLGGAGLTLVVTWGIVSSYFGAPMLAFADFQMAPATLVIAAIYFLLGYTFYASIMTGIGAVTNNMREAQQFAWMFTFANFIPFITMWATINNPNSGLAVGLSLFPMTAATEMMMRLGTGAVVPVWLIAASMGILALSAWIMLSISSRVFRIGLLMYGKIPNLPEILKWVTSKG